MINESVRCVLVYAGVSQFVLKIQLKYSLLFNREERPGTADCSSE